MTTDKNWPFDELRRLFKELIFDMDLGQGLGNGSYGMLSQLQIQKRLSKRNKRENIEKLNLLGNIAMQSNQMNLSQEDRLLIKQFVEMRPMFEAFLANQPTSSKPTSAPSRKISEVLDMMLLKANNCDDEKRRKKNTITKLLNAVGISVDDDYSKFHNADAIGAISKVVVDQADAKGDYKRKQLRYIKELATCGSNIDSDLYKISVINNLPNIEKTKKYEKKPHQPYSNEQLLEMFNPKYAYFKEHPDAFWACMIALFTGARANSAITLQYDDITEKDGIWCINFIENHPIKHLKNEASERIVPIHPLKHLKNEASERIVPIHPQLLDLGFVDYVQRRQTALNAKGTDFIFPKCQTKSGTYNSRYTVRVILNFLQEIGVKSGTKDSYDFHSFRKNASIAMQNAGIIATFINDIIGWEGKTTMEQSYSNHTLHQIKTEMSKFNYDFLSGHFAKWKEIMKKAK
ncbi:MAG: tyrosine-type recombinase/integrase [Alphaproteobacteria bacterium]|nr:tyrosine-type recombinase/integrase [Alphaproteobacteria bacterium]